MGTSKVIEKHRELLSKIPDLEIEDRNFIDAARNVVVGGVDGSPEERFDVRKRIDRAVEILYSHPFFDGCSTIEVYLREGNEKQKCVAVEVFEEGVKEIMIDNDLNPFISRYPNIEEIKLNDIGLLIVSLRESLDEYKRKFLNYYAESTLTHSVKNAIEYEQNLDAAIRNSLTGLYNVGYYKNQLRIEVEKRDSNVALLLIDIDFLKNYNFNAGHTEADESIKTVANIIQKNVRENWDIPARRGGDEFAVILKDVSIDYAVEIAERIRSAVEMHQFYNERLQPGGKLTVSIGIAHSPLHVYHDPKMLEIYADAALYASKERGRNTVTVFNYDDQQIKEFIKKYRK